MLLFFWCPLPPDGEVLDVEGWAKWALPMALVQLVQAEAVERQAMLASEFMELDLGSVVQRLQELVAGREEQAIVTMRATGDAERDVRLAQLASEEVEGRLAMVQAEHAAFAEHQQQQLSETQRLLEHHGQCMEVEQQESVARLELAAEQWSGLAGLLEGLPAVAGQLATAQRMAQTSQERVASLEEALEERELAISQLGRDLEALRDAQAAQDVAWHQRELGRLEAERREAILGEQRAAWSILQEIERASRAGAMRQARVAPCPTQCWLPHSAGYPCFEWMMNMVRNGCCHKTSTQRGQGIGDGRVIKVGCNKGSQGFAPCGALFGKGG